MTITNIIPEISVISRCASKQPAGVSTEIADTIEERFGLKLDSGNILGARAALKALLDEMSDDDVRRIHALMYSGRDGESAQMIKTHYCGTDETRADLIRPILEKIGALAVYLAKATERAEANGLDIDNF